VRIRKRIVSETETHRLVTVRGQSIVAWCPGCEQEVEMVVVECAEQLPGSRALRKRIAKSGHFAVTHDETLWVCRRWWCDHSGEDRKH
jgi:hypothetical protein